MPPPANHAFPADPVATARPSVLIPGFVAPVRVDVPESAIAHAPPSGVERRVALVTPCYNRPADAAALLSDLAGLPETARAGLRVLLVDNASDRPLSSLETPPGLNLHHLRLPANAGGSGGYNAGLRRVLALDRAADWRAFDPEFVWLVDSDARVGEGTLGLLIAALDADPGAIAAGAAIADPRTGVVFEVGGAVDRRTGDFLPRSRGAAGLPASIPCDYAAACCVLVRASALRAAAEHGLATFPDRFLNGDDVEWFIRLARCTGGRVIAVPGAVAMHPRFDRFPVMPRYYMARNAFGPLFALGLPRRVRLRRALREAARAVQQAAMGRHDLAKLHAAGLRHAAMRRITGAAPPGIKAEGFRPFSELSGALDTALPRLGRSGRGAIIDEHLGVAGRDRQLIERQLAAARLSPIVRSGAGGAEGGGALSAIVAALRLLPRPRPLVGVFPARGRPRTWWRTRWSVLVTEAGFVIRRSRPLRDAARALLTGVSCVLSAARIALQPQEPDAVAAKTHRQGPGSDASLLKDITAASPAPTAAPAAVPAALSMDVLILSFNRERPLRATIRALIDAHGIPASSIILADNASTAFDPAAITRDVPGVRLLRMESNLGVEGFNRAAAASSSDVILILDDDAIPAPGTLGAASQLLAARPDLAAVTLHPRHAGTRASEWPFAAGLGAQGTSDAWPVMGCANLVRRSDYLAVGGYDARWFLYRNDADLALKLLGAGRGVHFNRAWFVEHDSPAAPGAPKSPRWHRLATRNWVWLARRHGAGLGTGGWGAALLGWLHAHRLAGASVPRHIATLAGAIDGLLAPPPVLPRDIRDRLDSRRTPDRPFTRLMKLKLG